jgi:nitrite reductase/ring-hydroxylating ferredoxin subunit
MSRYEFLKSLGFGGASLLMLLTACQQEEIVKPIGPVDFELDLDDPLNAALKMKGGYVLANGVVVARATHGNLVAASQTCSHQKNKQVIYKDNEFFCPVHGARFDTKGNGLNEYGSKGLIVYKIIQFGSVIRVFS